MNGESLLLIAFGSCLFSVLAYFTTHLRRNDAALRAGRYLFHLTVLSVLLTAAIHLYNVLTHQFQFTYVWSYSSRDLSLPLLISTFYAGQEGSFLLWALFAALIGVFLLRDSSRNGYEPQVMTTYGLIQLALLLMLLVKDPFVYVWETWPDQVQPGFIPADGRGLNPLLRNYWMVIHPQVLFAGFASMGVPYAYALAGLLKRDYANWIRPATPWLAFGILVLGTGIIMGGFWAYETLGWGGYWAWDPVENSSLVPWLWAVAALHTMLSQRKNGSFLRLNFFLSMSCFLFILYSTFLTRSGVLGETSVHSFVDPGMLAYNVLLGVMGAFTILGVGMFLFRWRELPRAAKGSAYLSREFALFLGSFLLVGAALWITAGTSSPIITDLLYGRKSAMDITYYSRIAPGLGTALALLIGVGQLLWWTRSSPAEFVASLRLPFILSILLTLAAGIGGVRDPYLLMLVLGSAFALFANIQVGLRIVKGNPKFAGGAVAHVGVAIMFIGFLISSEYDRKETVSLAQGVPAEALGYSLTYMGPRTVAEGKTAYEIRVEKDGRQFVVAPTIFFSSYMNSEIRNPDIANLLTKDFYLAPLGMQQGVPGGGTSEGEKFYQGDSKLLAGYEVQFAGFDRPVVLKASSGGEVSGSIQAGFLVVKPGRTPKYVSLKRAATEESGEGGSVRLDDGSIMSLSSAGADPRDGRLWAQARITQPARPAKGQVLVVEASVKPLINLVWAGVIIALVGIGVTIYRRSQEARTKSPQG